MWFAVPLRPGDRFAHRQDVDIPAVAGSNQEPEDVFKHGKTEPRFSQIFRVKAEVKDPSIPGRRFQSPAEAFNTGSQCNDLGS